MDFDETLRRLDDARGDPDALALAAVDIVLSSANHPHLAGALEAAAVPHWFDEHTVRTLLGDAVPDAEDWYQQLTDLTVVEFFHLHEAWNVHEVTRLALRNRLARERPEHFRALGRRAASLVDGDESSDAIEQVYHLLTSDPDEGADRLRLLWKNWFDMGRLDALQGLGKSLDELLGSGLLAPRASAHALVALCSIRRDRIGLDELEKMARTSVQLGVEVGDELGLVDAYKALGWVLTAQGRSGESLASYESARSSLESWASGDRDPVELAEERAALHQEFGRALAARSQLADALGAFEACMELTMWLCEQQPENDRMRHSLAVAHADVGDALLPTPRSAEGETHFMTALGIIEELIANEQGPETIEQDLGQLHIRFANLLAKEGNFESAREEWSTGKGVFTRLVERDPEHLGWRSEVAQMNLLLGMDHLLQRNLDEADECIDAAREVHAELMGRDPRNPSWQQSLAYDYHARSQLRQRQGRTSDAASDTAEAIRLLKELCETDPERASWMDSLSFVEHSYGLLVLDAIGSADPTDIDLVSVTASMLTAFSSAAETRRQLVELDPENLLWQSSFASGKIDMGRALELVADKIDEGLDLDVGDPLPPTTEIREAALVAYDAGVTILLDLMTKAPDDATAKWEFTSTGMRSGALLETLGRPDDALARYSDTLSIGLRLTGSNASTEQLARSVEALEHAVARLEDAKNAEAEPS